MNAARRKIIAKLQEQAQEIADVIDIMLGDETNEDAVGYLETAGDGLDDIIGALGDAAEVGKQ